MSHGDFLLYCSSAVKYGINGVSILIKNKLKRKFSKADYIDDHKLMAILEGKGKDITTQIYISTT